MSDKVSRRKWYLSPRFLAGKVRQKGIVWCARRFLILIFLGGNRLKLTFRHEKLTFRHKLWLYFPRKRGIPGIVLSTLPKSGSVYIWQILSDALNIRQYSINIGHFPDSLIAPESTREVARGGIITVSHFPASWRNLLTLQRCGIDRIIVHVRDPRQAMLSWVHHVIERQNRQHPELVARDILPPDSYFSLPLTDVITWHIENFLPMQIRWIEGWLDASEDPACNLKVQFTKYEDLNLNPDSFFDSILQFYDIDKSLFAIPNYGRPHLGDLHFREGRIDEWRDVFTSEQSEKVTNMISARLYSKFGWRP